jgi:release factor glutamine methyltransferase
MAISRETLSDRLASAGCVASDEEADELTEAAAGDEAVLEGMVARRETGEPLAWITGGVTFLGRRIIVHPGVYVPRPQTEALARRAIELLPEEGVAVDVCTGSGAIAAVMAEARPQARILATDIDPGACRCAAANGVEVLVGHLADPLPPDLRGRLDVVVAVVPYVPSDEMVYLPRDVRTHEPGLALDGGPGGTVVLEEAVRAATRWLRPGGSLLLELGGSQDRTLQAVLSSCGFQTTGRQLDADGDLRGIEAVLAG